MHLPKPETMLAYASILEKPQYWIDPRGRKCLLATGEIIEAACAALRYCAELKAEAPSAKCTACGYEQGEHHYMGACYGICGEFVPASGQERI
jgi:hypothetical protein